MPTLIRGGGRLDSAVTTGEGRSNRGRQDNDEARVHPSSLALLLLLTSCS